MNRNKLKTYAPKARRDFIKAVTDRAAVYGLTKKKIEPVTVQGDVVIIGGKPFPKDVAKKRKRMEERIRREGFEQVMEAMAYTWFNRFVAIRFMELHGYLEHGYRVLSHPEGNTVPEIVEHAEHVDLPGLDQEKVIELKLDGTKESELYRMLLMAQCNALHKAMPFLFEAIGNATELLLPENLLHSDSLIRNLVNEIPEEDWQEIEIIGWLYQFYISEKKDQVIGKVVKSEDIPAATQLFTPNWIVKYMVQNSLGAQWLATYPDSPLKGRMAYYIEPAEQTDEVKAQLAAITPSTLNPEGISLIDPACGSGHILVEAYDLFKAIYLERGYRKRDVVQMILEKNLFGLDIDERAAQLAGFALMMKGRADDRRLFEWGVKLNVMALMDSAGFDAERLAQGVKLADYGLNPGDLTELKRLFEHATTFGSLIQVQEGLAAKLPALKQLSEATSSDLFVSEALKRSGPLVQQAELLAAQYDAVIANPPYMGGKAMNPELKQFALDLFPRSKTDLFSVSTERFVSFAKRTGFVGLMTPFTWMFLKSYTALRGLLLETRTLHSLIQPEYHAFFDSAYVPVCAFAVQNCHTSGYNASFVDLSSFYGADLQPQKTLEALSNPDCEWLHRAKPDEFKKIPGSPVAYWVSETLRDVFFNSSSVSEVADPRQGLATGRNDEFLRFWSEVDLANTSFDCLSHEDSLARPERWYPCQKGGAYRRWYGNHDYLVNWQHDGRALLAFKPNSVIRNPDYYFREGATWSSLSSSSLSMRYNPEGFIFESKGSVCFPHAETSLSYLIALSNSAVVNACLRALSPTLDYHEGPFGCIPFVLLTQQQVVEAASERAISIAGCDWNVYERSWDFQSLPILTASPDPTCTLEFSYTSWITRNRETIAEMKRLEEENNSLFIDAYGLQEELTPDVPIEQITLTVNPAYRYGGKLSEAEQWIRFRQDTMKELVSYAIGCMMGRYSLDAPGLIYAHRGNEDFDPSRYTTFPADDDGIVPLTGIEWFDDDACHRLIKFVSMAWDASHLEENLTFLADNLVPKKNESSGETIRRYLCDKFFKDHLQTYKKRPIYWLFSSGKLRAFQCLVYLHRYNEGTLSRMRTEYVIPLQGKIAARIEQLSGDVSAATSTAHRKKLEREKDKLVKQQTELQTFDEKLRHYADQRISLDLDDGVKVNYGKFGDLLAEVKAVTGKKPK
ncbi:MAG: BREX-1 system adenine-specific DNA-methyltransferase PglX [Deltaproteobacteria bacterium]|nr:BREX-1 system adenine-specific DNA-methyltransferase PglX [Deltaproteobacteria bacterium]